MSFSNLSPLIESETIAEKRYSVLGSGFWVNSLSLNGASKRGVSPLLIVLPPLLLGEELNTMGSYMC
jgi:hypothetical protein